MGGGGYGQQQGGGYGQQQGGGFGQMGGGGFGQQQGGGQQSGGQKSSSNDEKKDDDSDGPYNEICTRSVDSTVVKNCAAKLRKAMKGFGTTESKLNEVLGTKSKAEIQAIREAFITVDGSGKKERDLIKDLKSETSGNYEKILVALTYGPYEYDAVLVRAAVKGLGTNETQLTEVLCTRHPHEIEEIAKVYGQIFLGRDMLKDVTGHLKKVYSNIIAGTRRDGDNVKQDVDALYKAGEKRIGTNEKVFVELLSNRTRAYVEKLYYAYANKHNKSLERIVKSEFSGNLKNALLALCTPIPRYYTLKLIDSMKGMGTSDNVLVRVIASQKERYLQAIAKQFLQDKGKTLYKWIDGDTSGNYGKILKLTVKSFGSVN